jgi:hypothetical protein
MSPPADTASKADWDRKYEAALELLNQDDRKLVVGRLELRYSYEQLAVCTGRASRVAALLATRRAVISLARLLSLA